MKQQHRRDLLGQGIAAAAAIAAVGTPLAEAEERNGLAFGNRAHIFAPPEVKEALIRCCGSVLGCGAPVSLNAPGLAEPILAFRFPGGGSLSVEFTAEALNEPRVSRGAWMEIWSDDPPALRKRILDAGYQQVNYPATNTFYFALPGGQVLGIVSGRKPAGGELKTKQ